MTREECKNLLVEEVNGLGGVRADEFVAWGHLYTIEGFSAVFHPEMLHQLILENRVGAIEYTLPGKETPLTLLLPMDTKVKLVNVS